MDATGKFATWRLRLMELDFYLMHQGSVIRQVADTVSRLLTGGTDDVDIDNEIPIIVVTTSAQEKLSRVTNSMLKKTHNETSKPQLQPRNKFITAQCIDAFCDKIRRAVRIPGSLFTFDRYS